MPSFEGFVKDVDEVRVGLLERLALFLRGLSKADQRRLLPLLADFLCMDNQRSWRFRFALARQLKEIAALYSPLDVHQYLVPVVSELLVDKVAEVRHISVEAMVAVLQQLAPYYLMRMEVLQQLCEKAQDRKWCQRQLFCELAEQMISAECLSGEEFIGTVLPKLLSLRHDSVPNVRMALARCLVRGVWPKAFFWDYGNIYKDELKATLASLQEDTDRDVRFFAQLDPKASRSYHGRTQSSAQQVRTPLQRYSPTWRYLEEEERRCFEHAKRVERRGKRMKTLKFKFGQQITQLLKTHKKFLLEDIYEAAFSTSQECCIFIESPIWSLFEGLRERSQATVF